MTRYALVLSLEKEITVGLINRNGIVQDREHGLPSDNPRNLPVKKGSLVIVDENAKVQAVRGVISLLLPVCCAVAGYFLASPAASLLKIPVSEILKAAFILIFFSVSAATVFLVSRMGKIRGRPQIEDIIPARHTIPDNPAEELKNE